MFIRQYQEGPSGKNTPKAKSGQDPIAEEPHLNSRQIRHTARGAIRELDLGEYPDLQSIQLLIEARSGLPIIIGEMPTLDRHDLCGLWLHCEDCDYVLHAPELTVWHRQLIILHEFSHMILNHQFCATSLLLPPLPGIPQLPLMILGRSSFDSDTEVTAEYLADLLTERILRRPQVPSADPSGFNKVFG